jgi:hypothetical protein
MIQTGKQSKEPLNDLAGQPKGVKILSRILSIENKFSNDSDEYLSC